MEKEVWIFILKVIILLIALPIAVKIYTWARLKALQTFLKEGKGEK